MNLMDFGARFGCLMRLCSLLKSAHQLRLGEPVLHLVHLLVSDEGEENGLNAHSKHLGEHARDPMSQYETKYERGNDASGTHLRSPVGHCKIAEEGGEHRSE